MMNWLIGIKICYKCFNQAHKKSTRSLLLLWYCAGTNTVIMLIIIANMSRKVNKHIVKSMKNSIQSGMKSYLTDLDSKETIDTIQYRLECCGDESYKDWQSIEWMDDTMINTKSKEVEELRFDKNKLYLPVIPWSCCKIQYPMQCFHDPVQQTALANLWADAPDTITDSLNVKGCVEKMKAPLGWIIDLITMVISGITILHVITVLVSRILYTSCRNAVLLYDPEGIAPGWIFGRGDCGYARGKTLTEIMGITNEILEQRILEDRNKDKSRTRKGLDSKGSKSYKSNVTDDGIKSNSSKVGSSTVVKKRPKSELESVIEGATETEVSSK
ncbi:photoreceptor outer segment membrane glycoprotein 2 isoform X2 [Sitophilus oryzae]|nr:photoreceptor outer segment membrane glycoprotein 2 isoform X2 [Sitophilus oryzae]